MHWHQNIPSFCPLSLFTLRCSKADEGGRNLMRKYLIFFLIFFSLLSLAASCQKTGDQDPHKSIPEDSSQTDSSEKDAQIKDTTSATLPDDCDSPPGGLEDVNPGDLPPGFMLDPEEPDKYLYVKEWHG